jgi:carboxypeptidase A4
VSHDLEFECLISMRFSSFKAYDLTPNQDQIDKVLDWQNEAGVDFWRAGAAGRLSRVMIPPNLQQPFETFLKNHEIDYKVHIEDVGEVEKEFEADRVKRLAAKKVKSAVDSFAVPNFSVYWTSDEIDTYSRRLATTYPQLVQREVITRSFEGRDVFALKISRGGFGRKPAVFIDGGMHAREWVSQASMMYLIYRLVEDTETSNELLQNVDWIIIPNLNPVSRVRGWSTSLIQTTIRRMATSMLSTEIDCGDKIEIKSTQPASVWT